jgi:hypothetical protein
MEVVMLALIVAGTVVVVAVVAALVVFRVLVMVGDLEQPDEDDGDEWSWEEVAAA